MDDIWERTIPFLALEDKKIEHLLRRFEPKARVLRTLPMTEGKRTTNYRVDTADEESPYLVRIFPAGDTSWHKEAALRSRLHNQLPLQKLFYIGQDDAVDGRTFAVYEYAQGMTLLDFMCRGFKPEDALIREIGAQLALVHHHHYEGRGFLDGKLAICEPLPPLEQWYGMFLGLKARQRLGEDLTERIIRLASNKREQMREIDSSFSLTHGDYRPSNLLIHNGRVSSILDWEFAMAGHPLADIGQFFRYEKQFPQRQKEAFVQAYSEQSGCLLPANWEVMGKLRDMVNLLQMINTDDELPSKFRDVIRLIRNSVSRIEAENN